MTGSATLTGRFSVAVVTTLPESKVRVPEVFITLSSVTAVASLPVPDCASKFPVMSVGQRNWPIRPVIRRIASPCAEPAARLPPVQARKGAVRHKHSSRDTEIEDGRLSDICGSCFLCLTLVNIVSTVSYWCTNVCHIYYNTICVAGIMQRDIPF